MRVAVCAVEGLWALLVRGAFIIDAHDREVIAWCAVVNAGISGSDMQDMMLEAVEARFGTPSNDGSRLPAQGLVLFLEPSQGRVEMLRSEVGPVLLHDVEVSIDRLNREEAA